MSEFRRRIMMSQKRLLPEGYTRLQYIYNTSDAYIDTGILIDNTDTIRCKWSVRSGGGDNAIFGFLSSNTNQCWLDKYGGSGGIYPRYGSKIGSNTYTVMNYIEIVNGVWKFYRNETTIQSTWDCSTEVFTANRTMTLFVVNSYNHGLWLPGKNFSLESFEIENKWNGIPCTDPDGVVGMYDTVNQRFHSSPNGTAFIAGPVY